MFVDVVYCPSFGSDMAGTGIFKEIIDGDVYKFYVDGEWKVSTSGKSVGIINPSNLKPTYKVQGAPIHLDSRALIYTRLRSPNVVKIFSFKCAQRVRDI